MNLNFFDHREKIAKNLVIFIRKKGYSKLSLSKLSDVSRRNIDRIIKGEGLESEKYNKEIEKINKTFDLPDNYFIAPLISTTPTTYTCLNDCVGSERDPQVEELLDGLDNILDIYSLYLK